MAGQCANERLADAVEDVIDALSELNFQSNGSVPSESLVGVDAFPRSLIYAITEILRMLRELSSDRPDAVRAESLIAMAWSAILAGDIDDLKRHLADEERARG